MEDEISNKVTRLDGVTITYHEEECKNCMKCTREEVCMFDALSVVDGKINIDSEKCKGCGHCVKECKFNAITIDYTDEAIDNVINRMYNLIEE